MKNVLLIGLISLSAGVAEARDYSLVSKYRNCETSYEFSLEGTHATLTRLGADNCAPTVIPTEIELKVESASVSSCGFARYTVSYNGKIFGIFTDASAVTCGDGAGMLPAPCAGLSFKDGSLEYYARSEQWVHNDSDAALCPR